MPSMALIFLAHLWPAIGRTARQATSIRGTNIMASRSWFFATDGQQHGPYSEDQFRDLIEKGGIRPDTYVWSEGMAAWQFAGDVPGLLSRRAAGCFPNWRHQRTGRGSFLARCRYLGAVGAQPCACDRLSADHSGALGAGLVLAMVRVARARYVVAKSRVHRPADGRLVVSGRVRAPGLRGIRRQSIAQPCFGCGATGAVLASAPVVHRKHQLRMANRSR